ncbi:MAG: GNAT family N-acetyltransferase [Acidobacteriia bacterium]|nr:GNAT family N-acetyltransferase [Terriglobia bacterium]
MDAAALQQTIHNFPDLSTPRLGLRRLRWEDADDIFAYASDPQVTTYVFWEPHRTLDDTREFLQRTLKGYAEGLPPAWGMEHLADKVVIGTCGMFEVQAQHARAEIGYAVGRKYWGQGLMTEAVGAMLAYGFNTLGLNRIEARCDVENTGSWRVMEKVGMKLEGVLRQNIFLHGRPRDAKIYAILRKEWRGTSQR